MIRDFDSVLFPLVPTALLIGARRMRNPLCFLGGWRDFLPRFVKDGKMRSRWWFKIFLFIFYRDPWKHEMIQFDIGHIFVEVVQPPARVGAFERGEGSFGSATSLKNPQQSCFEQKKTWRLAQKIKLPQVFACCLCGRVTVDESQWSFKKLVGFGCGCLATRWMVLSQKLNGLKYFGEMNCDVTRYTTPKGTNNELESGWTKNMSNSINKLSLCKCVKYVHSLLCQPWFEFLKFVKPCQETLGVLYFFEGMFFRSGAHPWLV